MKKRYFYNSMLSALAMLILVGMSSEAFGQTFINQGSGQVTNSGCFKFNTASGELQNNVGTGDDTQTIINNSSGTITFMGQVVTPVFTGTNPIGTDNNLDRIQGSVRYINDDAGGNVYLYGYGGAADATYYTNLTLDGQSAKWIPDNVYVGGAYENNYLTSGSRSYTGTFYYDGSIAQTIAPENSNSGNLNRYNNMDLSGGGTKTIAYDGTNLQGEVYVINEVNQDATSALNVYDDFYVGHASGTGGTFAGNVTVGQGGQAGNIDMGFGDYGFTGTNVTIANGTFELVGTGSSSFSAAVAINSGSFTVTNTTSGDPYALFASTVNVADGGTLGTQDGANGDIAIGTAGSLTLANAAGAVLNLGTGTDMIVTGSFTNGLAARTNMTFGDGSNMIYNAAGAQTVVSTASTNPYSNLFVEGGGTKTLDANTNPMAYVDDNFGIGTSTYAGNVAFTSNQSGTFTFDDLTDFTYNALVMNTGTATYQGTSEVEGNFRRGSITGKLMADDQLYTYNNTETQLAFANAPALNDYMQLHVEGGQYPSTTYIDAPDLVNDPNEDDVNRLWVTHTGSSDGSVEINTLRLAFLASEATDVDRTVMRALEGTNVSDGNANREEKLNMHYAAGQTNGTSGSWEYFQLTTTGDATPSPLAMVGTGASAAALQPRYSFQNLGQGSAIALTDMENYLITIANGRWSSDDTWDEGRPPMSTEHAIVRHLVFTGMQGANILGSTGVTTSEAEVNGVTTVGDVVYLAKSVEITNTSYSGANPNNVALVFNNIDTDADAGAVNPANAVFAFGQGTQTNPGMVNNNDDPGTLWGNNIANLTSYNGLQGVYTMESESPGSRTNAVRGYQITNNGRFVIGANSCAEVGE